MRARLHQVFTTLLRGACLWLAGAFISSWIVHTLAGLAAFYLGGGYAKEGLSLFEALLRFFPLLAQSLTGLPFLCGYLLTWGVLRYWYMSGIAALFYLVLRASRLSLIQQIFVLVVCIVLQIVAYFRIGNPIDYRPVPLYEHMLYYIVPMVAGTLRVFGWARRGGTRTD